MGYLDRALDVNPELFTALLAKAVAMERVGDSAEAIRLFTLAADASSDDAKASILFRLGQLQYMCVNFCVQSLPFVYAM